MRRIILAVGLLLAFGTTGSIAAEAPPKPRQVILHYADMAQGMYQEAYLAAREMQTTIAEFLGAPSADALGKSRAAWVKARIPYMETEGFRFGNKIVDDWEGNVNAWPLDEGLIDYVDTKSYGEKSDENPLYSANIIGSKAIRIGKRMIDVSKITPRLLHELNTAGGVEANVASGWHAIEFLLWGQDLHGTERGAGERPYTDYDLRACTNGNCDRRAAYLTAATDALVADLLEMANAWKARGKARTALLQKSDRQGLAVIFTGLGSLSYGELAGERMKLGLILHDPEEEQDCFSDNTHNSHYYDEVGIISVYTGRYEGIRGLSLSGPSVADLVRAGDSRIADDIKAKSDAALAALKAIKDTADSGDMAYDMMLAEGNAKGNKLIQNGVDALIAQARAFEGAVSLLKLKVSVEGSDSLDNPARAKKK